MTITSEIIGKLGGSGGDMEKIPVDVKASGSSGSEEVLHTVEVPDGEMWLVAVYGDLQSRYGSGSSSAQLIIGTTELPMRAPNGITSLVHIGTGTINVKLRRNSSTRSDSFTGHVYTVKL